MWSTLYQRQLPLVKERACAEYNQGLATLAMPSDRVPQLQDINQALAPLTGWEMVQVPALISTERFFTLLQNKQFPAATFIRVPEELDYLEEPDIFHEFFGHAPMLTDSTFTAFLQRYAEVTLALDKQAQEYMARLFWFTVEFGLIETVTGPRCYGGGILSSKEETVYAVDSDVPERKPFDLLEVLRTPYRIDILQPIYFVIPSLQALFELLDQDIPALIQQAVTLGDFAPTFATEHYDADNDEWVTC